MARVMETAKSQNKFDLSKNSNVARVKCALDVGFFYKWISFLTPFHKLTRSERQVLAAFLNKRFELTQLIRDENIVNNVLNSVESRKDIRDSIGYSNLKLNAVVSQLKKGGVIVDNKIDKRYIPNIKPGTSHYRFTILFDIDDSYTSRDDLHEQTNSEDS